MCCCGVGVQWRVILRPRHYAVIKKAPEKHQAFMLLRAALPRVDGVRPLVATVLQRELSNLVLLAPMMEARDRAVARC